MISLNSNKLKLLLDKKLTLDCPQITLTPHPKNPTQKTYTGSGFVTQDHSDRFMYKIFPNTDLPASIKSAPIGSANLGKIIDDSKYYHFSAVDIEENHWEAERVSMDMSINFTSDNYIVSGHMNHLKTENSISVPTTKNLLNIYIPDKIDIPYNCITTIETSVGCEKKNYSGKRNVAKFSGCNLDFTLLDYDEWLLIAVTSDTSLFDYSKILRILEAMQFVLGISLSPFAIEFTQQMKQYTIIHPPIENIKSWIQPPIAFNAMGNPNSIWNLYIKYLEHFINYSKESWHPTSNLIKSVIESGKASLALTQLVLSVSVEGLLNIKFGNLALTNLEAREQIRTADKIISESTLTPNIKQRIKSSLGNMLTPRAKDRLIALRNADVIEQRLIDAWDDSRNPSAHGNIVNYIEMSAVQKQFNLCRTVLVLFYNLIFLAIGYTGEYTDYSCYNFPTKVFNNTFSVN